MKIEDIPIDGYERVAHATCDASGLNAVIAVHDTTLGPALGGIRVTPYEFDDACITDATRLAKGMTYKAAIAETGQGGGKGVMNIDPAAATKDMYYAMGDFIEALGGTYLAAEDMNMTVANLQLIAARTDYVTGLALADGYSGNPSPITAHGCHIGLQATALERFGAASLKGRCIAIQGIGAVGSVLAKLCLEDGATVAICDIDQSRVEIFAKETRAIALEHSDAALTYPCDILSPCARGGVLNPDSIPELQCQAIGGAANNQLLNDSDSELLYKRGILYAPDYVINAGGIINIACEFDEGGYSAENARKRCYSIQRALQEVFHIAQSQKITTAQAANQLAESRINTGRRA
ncbi:MAG: Glu/Leu/Phe/Val dehydrogenase dimerization domain-containing protein [Candidatus Hydrogenedentota bacterium]